MLNGCEWLRCILAYLEWLLWDHTENESDLTCNNTTFQDVYLNKPPPPSTLYKVWATQQDSLQQRDQKKTTRCQRCLWLVSGSREFSRDSAFSRSWCQARSWGGRLFSLWETTKTWQAPSKHNLQILSLGSSHKTRSCDHLKRDTLTFSNSSGNEAKLWLLPCFLGQSSRKPLVPLVFGTSATRLPSSTWAPWLLHSFLWPFSDPAVCKP